MVEGSQVPPYNLLRALFHVKKNFLRCAYPSYAIFSKTSTGRTLTALVSTPHLYRLHTAAAIIRQKNCTSILIPTPPDP